MKFDIKEILGIYFIILLNFTVFAAIINLFSQYISIYFTNMFYILIMCVFSPILTYIIFGALTKLHCSNKNLVIIFSVLIFLIIILTKF
jgi:hypothetical protein